MKNILRTIFIFVVGALVLVSCEKKETNFDAMTKDWDPNNTTYYLQITGGSSTVKETGVSLTGGFVEITASVNIVLIGNPLSSALTVPITIDPSSTLTADMFSIDGGLSLTIPAGSSSASATITSNAVNMPIGEVLNLTLILNDPNAAVTGATTSYKFKRAPFTPLANGPADLVGTWSGTDGQGGYTYSVNNVKLSNPTTTTIEIKNLSNDFIVGFWGETITAFGTVVMDVKPNGLVDIPRQYIYTTVYNGAPYDYEIIGSGKWDNTGAAPTLKIDYDIYYPGDAEGLALTYASYLDGIPYLTADITLSGGLKNGVTKTVTLPPFK